MKKLFSLLLVCMFLLASVSVTVTAAADTTDPFEGDSEVNIVYFGGSYIADKGEGVDKTWVEQLQTYFTNNYATEERTVNHYNVGISGDTSMNGSLRVQRDVLSKNPDLVIINFTDYVNYSSNGGNLSLGYERAHLESIILTLRASESNPRILFVTLPSSDLTHLTDGDLMKAYVSNNLAGYYGVNSMNISGFTEESFGTDGKLTQDAHNAVYNSVYNNFRSAGVNAYCVKPNNNAAKNGGSITEGIYWDADSIRASSLDGATYANDFEPVGDGSVRATKAGAQLEIRFTGNAFSIKHRANTGKYIVKYTEKGQWKTDGANSSSGYLVDTATIGDYGRRDMHRQDHQVFIVAEEAGVIIEGFSFANHGSTGDSLNKSTVTYADFDNITTAATANSDQYIYPYTWIGGNNKVLTGRKITSGKSSGGRDLVGYNGTYGLSVNTGAGNLRADNNSPIFSAMLEEGVTYRISYKIRLQDNFPIVGKEADGSYDMYQKMTTAYFFDLDGEWTMNNVVKESFGLSIGNSGLPSSDWCTAEATFTCPVFDQDDASKHLFAVQIALGSATGTVANYEGSDYATAFNWYLDDVVIDAISGSNTDEKPAITLSATGDQSAAGNTITVAPDYQGVNGKHKYLYRVSALNVGNWVCRDTGCVYGDAISYTTVADDIGRKLKFDVIAYDDKGNYSAMKTYTAAIDMALDMSSLAGGSISMAKGDECTLLVAFYEGETPARFVGVEIITIKANEEGVATIPTVSAPAGAAAWRAFAWESLENPIPLVDSVSGTIS